MSGLAMGVTLARLRDLFDGASVVGLDDAGLLARYAESGDGPAFEALVARHGPMVWATCRGVLRRSHDAEDAFQATFLVLARKAGSVSRGDALAPWLHRVATRAAVQAGVEARKRRLKEGEAVPDLTETPPDPALADELKAAIHQEIDRLPEARRLPVLLCDLEGLTYDEAARRLRWSPAAVRSRLARGRQTLRDRLSRRGFTAPLVLPFAPRAVPDALLRSVVGPGSIPPAATALARSILGGCSWPGSGSPPCCWRSPASPRPGSPRPSGRARSSRRPFAPPPSRSIRPGPPPTRSSSRSRSGGSWSGPTAGPSPGRGSCPAGPTTGPGRSPRRDPPPTAGS